MEEEVSTSQDAYQSESGDGDGADKTELELSSLVTVKFEEDNNCLKLENDW